jgi:hypothetical protein
MSSHHAHRHRFLSTLHIVAMLGIVLWWALWFWQHTPARQVWAESPARRGSRVGDPFPGLERSMDKLALCLRLAGADLAFGATTLLLFAIGSGVYVRRLEIWLGARTSGQAVALGTGDLEGQALAANAVGPKGTP